MHICTFPILYCCLFFGIMVKLTLIFFFASFPIFRFLEFLTTLFFVYYLDVPSVVMEMLDKLVDEDSELISLYYGKDYEEEACEELAELIRNKYPDLDVEENPGGQPIYYIVLSVE